MPRAYSRASRIIREPRPVGGGICELDLTMGFVAIIDEQDATLVSSCNWCASRNQNNLGPYAKGRPEPGGKLVRLHRFILGFPDSLIDHINGDRLDNRRQNIRMADGRHNNANRGLFRTSASGFKGVHLQRRQFIAVCDSQRIGTFATAFAAARAYDAAAIKRFGQFARTNETLGLLEPQQ